MPNRKRARIQGGSRETLSRSDHWWLERLDNDTLRRTANDLTIKSGHGSVRCRNGDVVMLGSNTLSHTRRVLDDFVPVRLENLDLKDLL